MRRAIMVCFFLALLPIFALGHDLYLAYLNAERAHVQIWDRPVLLSDLGWALLQYFPDAFDTAYGNIDSDTWINTVGPLLEQKNLFLAAIPATFMLIILTIINFLQNLPVKFKIRTTKKDPRKKVKRKKFFAPEGFSKSKSKMKYKRK